MSFARIATLRISDQSYDLMHFRYRFHRKTDWHGMPMGGMRGGDIVVTMESTKSTELLESLLNTDPEYPASHPPRAISGSVEVCDPEDGKVIRRLVFDEAFLYAIGENLNTYSPLPMMQTVAISPLRLDINRNVRMDRRFPQTYAFWWDRYKEDERMVATYEKTEAQLQILRIYWIDEQDEQRELSELFVGQSVTMCVEVEAAGAGKTIDLTIKAPTGTTIKGGGTYSDIRVDGKSTAYIDNFQLEPQS
jgi:hypothetical protein